MLPECYSNRCVYVLHWPYLLVLCLQIAEEPTPISTPSVTPPVTPTPPPPEIEEDPLERRMRKAKGTYVCTRTHTCITTARIGHVAPIQGVSQQKATRPVAPLAAGTPTSSSQLHGPLSAVGVLIYGLARPMR